MTSLVVQRLPLRPDPLFPCARPGAGTIIGERWAARARRSGSPQTRLPTRTALTHLCSAP